MYRTQSQQWYVIRPLAVKKKKKTYENILLSLILEKKISLHGLFMFNTISDNTFYFSSIEFVRLTYIFAIRQKVFG